MARGKSGSVLRALLVIAFVLSASVTARADTFFLNDGTILIGKVLRETSLTYVVANAYGIFTVRKENLNKIYITTSYQEDILIQKKMGLKADEASIRKNVEEGLKRKKIEEALEKKKKEKAAARGVWEYGRLGLEAAYYTTMASKSLFDKVPHGLAASLAYDQGLDRIIGKRHMAMPGLRVEAGALDFERSLFLKSSRRLSGLLFIAGPMWVFPSLDNGWGCIVLAALPGAGFYDIVNRDSDARRKGIHFSFAGVLGYEYSFSIVALFVHFRYLYILDSDISFHGIGGSFGASFRLW